jgi:hypothetical protein
MVEGMSQSNIIFGFLFVAFVVYATARGELGTYLNLLLRPNAGSGQTNATVSSAASAAATAVSLV